MTEISPLTFVSTDEILAELKTRHSDAQRAMIFLSLQPAEDRPKEMQVRMVMNTKNKELIHYLMTEAMQRLAAD